MNSNSGKVAIVLEGGAMKALYSAGVLDVFLKEGIAADALIGVSAGALFGVNYKTRQPGRAIRYNLKYIDDPRYFGLSSLIKTGDIMGKDFAFYTVPTQLDIVDSETFRQTPEEFYCVVANMNTGKAEYIKIDDLDIERQSEALRASGSLPYLSRPVEVDGQLYLDGGSVDSIPLEKALEMGFEKIIVVLTKHRSFVRGKDSSLLPKLFYGKKYPEFARALSCRNAEYTKQFDFVWKLEKEGRIFVFSPSENIDISRVEKDKAKLQAMYDLGIKDAENSLEALKEYLKK